MLDPNPDLERIFERAIKHAMNKKHEYITLEHFLYGLLLDEKFGKLLTNFGTNIDKIKEDINGYIDIELQSIITDDDHKPKKTHTMERMLNRAFTQVLFSGRSTIEPVDCFLSIFQEKKSYACHALRKSKIDKDKFIEYINQ